MAIAIDPRALPGAGPTTCVRVDLDSAGEVVIRLTAVALPIAIDGGVDGESEAIARPSLLVLLVEPLVPLPDEGGYHEPTWQTSGDRERRSNRDGRRRTA